jgi:hypothetical protein
MSTQHTPGPWWETESGVRDRGGLICHTVSPQRYPGQEDRFERETIERTANKKLIAAAPDMYEALKHEAEWHEREARTHKMLAQRGTGVYDGLKEAWHRERAAALRAVLAKAEGKS